MYVISTIYAGFFLYEGSPTGLLHYSLMCKASQPQGGAQTLGIKADVSM